MFVWERDPGTHELVEYFDRPEIREGGWERLAGHPDEVKVVTSEIIKCRQDFAFFARNYAWIKTKDRKVKPFALWPSQELLLEKVYELKAKGKAQKILILKARQLGFSTVIEAMMAWRTMFFENVQAIIVSHAPHHSVYLFNIMCHIYDMLPWWMQPACSSRRIEEGLIFDNPTHKTRSQRPGLKSLVVVQAANQMTGVGQGYAIQAAHLSEIADWDDQAAKEIIDGDLAYALAEGPETFAFMETTAKGSGRYFHKVWEKQIEMAENAEWEPFFVPWFFEQKRKIVDLGAGWVAEEPEEMIRRKIANQWLRCDFEKCGKYRETVQYGRNVSGTECPVCKIGTLQPHLLEDGQLAWMMYKRKNAQKDLDALKEYHQELPSTAEEAFQISGVQVFPHDAMEWVRDCIEINTPIATGFMDNSGVFHGVSTTTGVCPVDGCDVDHRFDELPITLWNEPEPGGVYTLGVDVAEGLGGEGDYSTIFVNKVNQYFGPDEQVASYRSNMVDPISFAFPIAALGRWYNEGMVSIEVNKYDTTFTWVRNQLQYTNLYRWKHVDSTNPHSNKWGWETNMKSRPRLYQTATKFLKAKMWMPKSKNFYREMQHFQKDDYEDRRVEHSLGEYDDELMAGMIALYCSHDMDYDDTLGMIPIRRNSANINTFTWRMTCLRCHNEWGAMDPNSAYGCPKCSSPHIRGDKQQMPDYSSANPAWLEMTSETSDEEGTHENDYELM